MKNFKSILAAAVVGAMAWSCAPQTPSKTELGALPTVDYSASFVDSNTVKFTSISTGDPFIYRWDIDGIGTYEGEEVQVFIQKAGTYGVTHTVFNQGGSASTEGQVEILVDADLPCEGTIEFLTGCGSREWKLNPAAGSLWVGPPDASTTWWAIGPNAATDRPCAYNDTWTFTEDGTMIYNTNGDIWAETFMGVAQDGCQPESFLAGALAPWASGTHALEIGLGSGATGNDQIKLSGLGAFIGLQKVSNGAEVTTPASAVTYDILWMDEDATTGARTMEIECLAGGVLWRYTLLSE
jgi:PKD repeat protein